MFKLDAFWFNLSFVIHVLLLWAKVRVVLKSWKGDQEVTCSRVFFLKLGRVLTALVGTHAVHTALLPSSSSSSTKPGNSELNIYQSYVGNF